MPTTTASAATTEDGAAHGRAPRPPKLRGGLPLVGHGVSFIRDTIGLLERAREECGDVAGFNVFGRSFVLFTGPEAHEAVFRMPDEKLSPNAAYKMMVPVFGEGVAYDCEPERMNEQMRMLLPALQHKRMRHYGEIVHDEVVQSVAGWGDRGVIDLYEYAQALTSYTSSHCLLGREFRLELNEEFARVYHDLERGIIPIGYLHAHLPIPAFRARDRARARLGEMVAGIVAGRRQSGHRGEDFLQTLMESEYKDGSRLSDHEITGLLIAAMFAGHHTSSVTVAWTLFELLQNPTHLAAVVEELDRVYPKGEPVSYKSVRELHHTGWAVKEALRLHPPLFILLRVAMEDLELCGYHIPKGTWVAVSPTVAHRIGEVFQEPEAFCPHRFGPPREEDQQPFAYIAFGGGRHKCLGNAFALLQVTTIMAVLLRHYRFELTSDPIEPDFRGLVIGPKAPCRVRYERIT